MRVMSRRRCQGHCSGRWGHGVARSGDHVEAVGELLELSEAATGVAGRCLSRVSLLCGRRGWCGTGCVRVGVGVSLNVEIGARSHGAAGARSEFLVGRA